MGVSVWNVAQNESIDAVVKHASTICPILNPISDFKSISIENSN